MLLAVAGAVLLAGQVASAQSGDFDGDRRTDTTVYRPDTGYWYTLQSAGNYTTYLAQQWGVSTDIPVSGDFDGDGKATSDLTTLHGTWWILKSAHQLYVAAVGHTRFPVSGDRG